MHGVCCALQLCVPADSICCKLAQDLDSMRQDLATYASDLKIEQDHAVRGPLTHPSELNLEHQPASSTCKLVMATSLMAYLIGHVVQASARQQLATTSAALQHAERHHHCRVKELQKRCCAFTCLSFLHFVILAGLHCCVCIASSGGDQVRQATNNIPCNAQCYT